MSSHDDKVKRLLDGEIDEAEIASDPVLASLAERIFGLNIEPIIPTKPSQPSSPEVEVITAKTSLDPMIEVIPGAAPVPLPLPELPSIPKDNVSEKKGGLLKIFGASSLIISITNMFGVFGFLNSQCTAEKCTADATRINWIDIHNINNELGWSMPFPEIGIPDYIAVACSILVLIVAFRRK